MAGVNQLTHRQRIGAVVAGSAGNLVEWYDFYVYAFTALYFASSFFPAGDRTAQLLNVAGVYAAGFLIRPVGGWFFGRIADRKGRQSSMVVSVLLMGAGSFLIAVAPTYATIGTLAPALLLLARLIQGFSTGGEFGTAATYLSEVATDDRRGFYSSFQYVTLIGGQLGALLVLLVMQQFIDDAAMRAWGWRVPFAIGGLASIGVLAWRRTMHETLPEKAKQRADSGTLRELFRYPKSLLIVVSLTAGGALTLYTFTTYMQKFLVNTTGLPVARASVVMTWAMVGFMIFQPIMGILSDIIGRRKCLMLFGGLMALTAVPILSGLAHATPLQAFFLVLTALGILSFYSSISGLFKAELFPAHVRALGVAVAHSVGVGLFGGSAEFVALWFKRAGHEPYFYWYVAAVCASSFITALLMGEPKRATMQD